MNYTKEEKLKILKQVFSDKHHRGISIGRSCATYRIPTNYLSRWILELKLTRGQLLMDAITEGAAEAPITQQEMKTEQARYVRAMDDGFMTKEEAMKVRGYPLEDASKVVTEAIATIQRLAPSFIIAVEMGPNTFVDMKGSANDHNMLLSFIGIKGLRFYKKEDIKI